jgi:hypothetical protein
MGVRKFCSGQIPMEAGLYTDGMTQNFVPVDESQLPQHCAGRALPAGDH